MADEVQNKNKKESIDSKSINYIITLMNSFHKHLNFEITLNQDIVLDHLTKKNAYYKQVGHASQR